MSSGFGSVKALLSLPDLSFSDSLLPIPLSQSPVPTILDIPMGTHMSDLKTIYFIIMWWQDHHLFMPSCLNKENRQHVLFCPVSIAQKLAKASWGSSAEFSKGPLAARCLSSRRWSHIYDLFLKFLKKTAFALLMDWKTKQWETEAGEILRKCHHSSRNVKDGVHDLFSAPFLSTRMLTEILTTVA